MDCLLVVCLFLLLDKSLSLKDYYYYYFFNYLFIRWTETTKHHAVLCSFSPSSIHHVVGVP